MKIALTARTVDSLEFGYTVSLVFSGGWELRIETPFELNTRAGAITVDPGADSGQDSVPLAALVGRVVHSAEVSDGGVLNLSFGDGSVVTVEPDEDYESWTMDGSAGEKLVCQPGGEIAVWSAAPDTDR